MAGCGAPHVSATSGQQNDRWFGRFHGISLVVFHLWSSQEQHTLKAFYLRFCGATDHITDPIRNGDIHRIRPGIGWILKFAQTIPWHIFLLIQVLNRNFSSSEEIVSCVSKEMGKIKSLNTIPVPEDKIDVQLKDAVFRDTNFPNS